MVITRVVMVVVVKVSKGRTYFLSEVWAVLQVTTKGSSVDGYGHSCNRVGLIQSHCF